MGLVRLMRYFSTHTTGWWRIQLSGSILPFQIPLDDQHREHDAGYDKSENQNIFHIDITQAICYSMRGGGFPPLPLATRSASQLRGAPQ